MASRDRVASRRLTTSPDAHAAKSLLHEIAARPVTARARPVDKPLALYGAGALGKLAKQYFDRLGIPVAFVIDADAATRRSDPFWRSVALHAPEEVSPRDKAAHLLAICVGKVPYTRVVTPLAESGWSDMVPFYTITASYADRHPLGNGWFVGELTQDEVDGIGAVLRAYDDDASRAHHLQFLAWHRLHEEWVFDDAPVNTENRYFIDEVADTLGTEESLLDLGAHHGSVCRTFLERVGHRFREIWAVEPDDENRARLQMWMDALPADERLRMHVLACAVGRASTTQVFFDGLDFASQFCDFGNVQVAVRRIDDLGLRPSFIKAHIEGAELDAILGGVGTIRAWRPLVTLAVYHNRLGLWECPKALMDAFRDCGYRYKFRLHSWHGTGAVLYLLNR